jgi:O-antigen ligase
MVTSNPSHPILGRQPWAAEHVLLALEVVVLGWLLMTEGPTAALWLLFASVALIILGIAVSIRWPLGAVTTLILASAMPRLAGSVFGLHVRPEHVGVAAVLLILLSRLITGQLRSSVSLLDYVLVVYVLFNVLTSAFFSPEPRLTLRWAALNAIVIGSYFLIRLLVSTQSALHNAFKILLWVGASESAYGIFCFFSHRAFGTNFGIAADQYGVIPGTHGTQYEANLFGSYSACCAVMFFAIYLLDEGVLRKGRILVGLGLCTAAALVSLCRAALAALLVVGLLIVIVGTTKRQLRLRQVIAAVCSFALLLLLISPFIGSFLQERFSTIELESPSADSSTWIRMISLGAALENIRSHPVFGSGTDSFQLTFNPRDYVGPSELDDYAGWISNTPVRVLHDTGIIGLGIFLAFLLTLAVQTVRAVRVAGGYTRVVIMALAAGLLVYAITFQTTEATLLAFPWVHFGLLAAAVNIILSHRPLFLSGSATQAHYL